MQKLLKFLVYISRAQKCWRWPKQSDVLIYDACNQEVLEEYLHLWKPEVLHMRGEKVNVRVLFESLFKGGREPNAYIDCFIKRVQPRLIVTFIDNSLRFLTLHQRHPEIKTLFIQNGLRGYYCDIFELLDKMDVRHSNMLTVDYMLVFGSVIGAEYARYVTGTVVPIGSIKNNLIPKAQSLQRDVIAFASQWHKDGFYMGDIFYTQKRFFEQVERPIVKCLSSYAKNKNKRMMIIPRNNRYSHLRAQEEAYFHHLLGEECIFLEPQGLYSSYQALDSAEVVVTVDSSLGYESIARGNKTAFCSTRTKLFGIPGFTYGWPGDFPQEGPFWTDRPDASNINKILDYLFEVDDVQWRKDVDSTNFSSLMTYNPDNTILKSILERELRFAAFPLD